MTEEINSKPAEVEESKDQQKKDKSYDWVGEGIDELKEDIKVIFRPTISIPRDRYEELLKAETTLECLCRVLAIEKPYNAKFFYAVAGEKYLPASTVRDGDDE